MPTRKGGMTGFYYTLEPNELKRVTLALSAKEDKQHKDLCQVKLFSNEQFLSFAALRKKAYNVLDYYVLEAPCLSPIDARLVPLS